LALSLDRASAVAGLDDGVDGLVDAGLHHGDGVERVELRGQ
jgi:hypothetical protein